MPLRRDPNFGYLLAGILSMLVIGPLAAHLLGIAQGPLVLLSYNALLIIGIWSLHDRRSLFIIGAGLATINVALSAISIFVAIPGLRALNLLILLCFQLLSISLASQVVFSSKSVSINQLTGAACIYLLLGMCWGILYIFTVWVNPAALTNLDLNTETVFWDAMYHSFVTLTTLGYGDILPVTPFAKALSYMEAVVGQIYIALLIGLLVGSYIAERRKDNHADHG